MVVIGQLQPGLLDLSASDVQSFSDNLELLDRPEALVDQWPGDVRMPDRMGAFDAAVDVSLQVVDAG